MKLIFTLLALLPYLTKGNPLGSDLPWRQAASRVTGAAYVMTNQPDGNFVISNEIGKDGKLTVRSAFSAEGVGSRIVNNSPGVDPLFSQGSVIVSGSNLYVVNAGSNTVATFRINTRDPTQLQLVGRPVSSGGEFPMAIAVSQKRGLVCVLNAGRINGISCFKPSSSRGLVPAPDTQRFLHLNQTTPPARGPAPNGLGNIKFNEAETQLIVSMRGVFNPGRGVLAVWDVNPYTGALSRNFRQINANGAMFSFGMAVLPGKNAILAGDPGIGYEIFDLSGRNRSKGFPVQGQRAICWAVLHERTNNVFLLDAVANIISEVSVDNNLGSSLVNQYPLGNRTQPTDGAITTVGGKDFLYALTGASQSIHVLALQGPGRANIIQNLSLVNPLAKLRVKEDPTHFQGMAVFLTDAKLRY